MTPLAHLSAGSTCYCLSRPSSFLEGRDLCLPLIAREVPGIVLGSPAELSQQLGKGMSYGGFAGQEQLFLVQPL